MTKSTVYVKISDLIDPNLSNPLCNLIVNVDRNSLRAYSGMEYIVGEIIVNDATGSVQLRLTQDMADLLFSMTSDVAVIRNVLVVMSSGRVVVEGNKFTEIQPLMSVTLPKGVGLNVSQIQYELVSYITYWWYLLYIKL